MKKQGISSEWVINAFILIIAFYPPLGILNYINPVILLYCVWRYGRVPHDYIKYGVLTAIFCSFCVNLFLSPLDINMQSTSRAIMICSMIAFFPFAKEFRLYNITIYIGIFYLLFSQVMYFIHFEPLIHFYNTFYPYNGEINLYTSDYLSQQNQMLTTDGRFGGLFHNPNDCARVFTFFLTALLIENPIPNKVNWTVAALVIFGILLTGSRTGLFIGILLCISDVFLISGRKKSKRFLLLSILLMFLVILYNSVDTGSFRALRLSEGTEDSLRGKIEFFMEYIGNEYSTLHILFGHFDQHSVTQYLREASTMDSEWGYSVFNYGVVFTFFIVIFYIKRIRLLVGRNLLIVIPMLWMISSSILFTFKESMLYFILFSIYSCRSAKKEFFHTFPTGNNCPPG